MIKRKLGAVPSPKDDRDYRFSELIGKVSKIEPYTNPVMMSARNQEQTSMCGAFAGTSYRYAREWIQNGNETMFSVTAVYGADTYVGEGMYGRSLAKILTAGIPLAQSWDVIGTKEYCQVLYKKHKDKIIEESKPYRCNSYYYCDTWTDVLNAIRACTGCIIMIPIYQNWYACSNGVVGKDWGNLDGYHFVYCLDYVQKDNGAYRIRFINSWGDEWGDNGFGYLDTDVNGFTEAFAVVDNIEEVKRMFKDVEGHWAKEHIEKAIAKGIVNGYEDGTFKPDKTVTRGELMKILDKLGLLE